MEEIHNVPLLAEVPEKRERWLELPNPVMFAAKAAFVWAATFAFVPLIAARQAGRLSALAYALVLVALHLLFIAIYFWRVKFRAPRRTAPQRPPHSPFLFLSLSPSLSLARHEPSP